MDDIQWVRELTDDVLRNWKNLQRMPEKDRKQALAEICFIHLKATPPSNSRHPQQKEKR